MAHSGFGRRTNHSGQFSKLFHIGDSRRTMGAIALARLTSRPWAAGENEREPCRNILCWVAGTARFRLSTGCPEKLEFLFEYKAGENYNRRNIFHILRIII